MRKRMQCVAAVATVLAVCAWSGAHASPTIFSTGDPDGLIGTASRPASAGKIETESADDFLLGSSTRVDGASFTGLLTGGASVSDIGNVRVEIYRVFPKDSVTPPSGNVPTRTNSPSDVALDTREAAAASLSFAETSLGSFSVNNSVVNGINAIPNQTTGGEGAASGTEVRFDVTFLTPFLLPADHYFFVPQVDLGSAGNFLWLSAPKPIVPPGMPFTPDLQSWIRNDNLAPDWLRVGTDIVGPPATGGPAPTFNASFALQGVAVPEPASLALFGFGIAGFGFMRRKRAA